MHNELILFLLKATFISLSGVMAPGPTSAATLAAGVHRRHAGAWIAVGHGMVEFPLMLLIMLIMQGIASVLKSPWFGVSVGLAGGAMLLLMAAMMLFECASGIKPLWERIGHKGIGAVANAKSLRKPASEQNAAPPRQALLGKPIWTGVAFTAGNPYFLVWWATVGLALTTEAVGLGMLAFALFAVVHWLCDLGWLEALSLASNRGAKLMGPKSQKVVLLICGAAMAVFGVMFLWDAGWKLWSVGR